MNLNLSRIDRPSSSSISILNSIFHDNEVKLMKFNNRLLMNIISVLAVLLTENTSHASEAAIFAPQARNRNKSDCGERPYDRDYGPLRHISFETIKTNAQRGDKLSQFEIGFRYEVGEEVPKDLRQALKWYKRSARNSKYRKLLYTGPLVSGKNGKIIELSDRIQSGLPIAALQLDYWHCVLKGAK